MYGFTVSHARAVRCSVMQQEPSCLPQTVWCSVVQQNLPAYRRLCGAVWCNRIFLPTADFTVHSAASEPSCLPQTVRCSVVQQNLPAYHRLYSAVWCSKTFLRTADCTEQYGDFGNLGNLGTCLGRSSLRPRWIAASDYR
jgi:hypothetical protein